MILPDRGTILALDTLGRHPRAHHFGQSIQVDRVDAGAHLDLGAQTGNHRRHEANIGHLLAHQRGGGEEPGGQRAYFRAPAARQQRDDRRVCRQSERDACRGAIRHLRNHVRDRMADVSPGHALLRQDRRLERKDAQHVIGRRADLFDTVGTPRPDRRTDEMHGLDAPSAQSGFEVEVEIGRVDADEKIGPFAQQAGLELAADAGDFGVVAQDLDIAAHRQLLLRPPALESTCQHLGTADACSFGAWPSRAQPIEQQPGQQIARRLAGDQCKAPLVFRRHHRLSARCRVCCCQGNRSSARHRPPTPALRARARRWRRAHLPACDPGDKATCASV